ncbi:MAG: glycine--tRNA ligase subunit beta [Gammaproteobacteria bacterium]|nr:glycine--tRNA ligase subunit beta [Gammaproteobacteria bacterium]
MQKKDFLFELLTEELPPKNLQKLSQSLLSQIEIGVQKAQLTYKAIRAFATPRRLAIFIEQLSEDQPDQIAERQGPSLSAAFDDEGNPTQACIGFAKSCGIKPNQLEKITTDKGAWVYFRKVEQGKNVAELMPGIIQDALSKLPIEKLMRWADLDIEFVRPVHNVLMLYGTKVIDTTILNDKTNNKTKGHRFLSFGLIKIPSPKDYESILEKHFVIVDFEKRKTWIQQQIEKIAKRKKASPIINEELLDEVTALVEYPVALIAQFSKEFLELPKELIIASVQKHQRSFLLEDSSRKLLPFFITISNITSLDETQIIRGNERVMNARLSDAKFFYRSDLKHRLEVKTLQLENIIFQKKLGNMLEKTNRIAELSTIIAKQIKADILKTERAAFLCKADLASEMVGEFPELQGIMGYYYAMHDKEPENVSVAILEHYRPINANAPLPQTAEGQSLALADRIDTLVGIFGINKKPTGDKDPFGLRRAAIGMIRIIIENHLTLNLLPFLKFSKEAYEGKLINQDVEQEVLEFILERLKYWAIEQANFGPNLFNAVKSVCADDLSDFFNRMKAVFEFQKWAKSENLITAHKRVNNLLSKEKISQKKIDSSLVVEKYEKKLVEAIEKKQEKTRKLTEKKEYLTVLKELSSLRDLVDRFFDHIMVMVEDEQVRNNRLAILFNLKALFLQVADIGLL